MVNYAAYGVTPETTNDKGSLTTSPEGINIFTSEKGAYSKGVVDQLGESNTMLNSAIDKLREINTQKEFFELSNVINAADTYQDLQAIQQALKAKGADISINIEEPEDGHDIFFQDFFKYFPQNSGIHYSKESLGDNITCYPLTYREEKNIGKLLNNDGKNFSSMIIDESLSDETKENYRKLNEVFFRKTKKIMTAEYNATLAISSPMTGLHNKDWFDSYGKKSLDIAKDNGVSYCAFMADINDFKKFNTDYGHLFGDEVIKVIAKVLDEIISKIPAINTNTTETYASYPSHWGGDESAGILLGLEEAEIKAIFNKIISELNNNYEVIDIYGNRCPEIPIPTLSIGYIYMDGAEIADDIDFSDVMKNSNKNMFIAKDKAKSSAEISQTLELMKDLITKIYNLCDKYNIEYTSKNIESLVIQLESVVNDSDKNTISAYYGTNSIIHEQNSSNEEVEKYSIRKKEN